MNAIEQLKSVLCDPEGKCCITGSNEDRAIVDRALQSLAKQEQPYAHEAATYSNDRMTVDPKTGNVSIGKQEQGEPVAHIVVSREGQYHSIDIEWSQREDRLPLGRTALYTTPQQRKPLTREQIYAAIRPLCTSDQIANNLIDIGMDEYRAIEAAHGIKE